MSALCDIIVNCVSVDPHVDPVLARRVVKVCAPCQRLVKSLGRFTGVELAHAGLAK